jgi:hypothetical protein
LLRNHHPFQQDRQTRTVEWAAFSQNPPDARSACLAGANLPIGFGEKDAEAFRGLGAPTLFGCSDGRMLWYQHEVGGSRLLEGVEARHVPNFFEAHRAEFAPQRIYRAKTSARFDAGRQLDFVDLGLMPLLERETGQRLGEMVESLLAAVHESMPDSKSSRQFARWLFQSAFWLLAARLLRDKNVPSFKNVDVADPDDVFDRVARHYGAKAPVMSSARERAAIAAAAGRAAAFPSLANVTTESLAYVYENTLVSADTRAALGTHSTPPWLVDYMVWQLAPWIEELQPEARHIVEPACGHSAFLVAGVRLLRELYDGPADEIARLRHLREHIHGVEVDDFAREIGRLSLTLADVPHPNGWKLTSTDMFAGNDFARLIKKAGVVLSNPPFEDFTPVELRHYNRLPGLGIRHVNKAVEVFARTLDNLPDGGLFGFVVPQLVLNGKGARQLRDRLLRQYEVREVCLLPDKVFENSSVETAVVLGRRRHPALRTSVYYRRVREWDMSGFVERLEASTEARVPQSSFLLSTDVSLRLADLQEVWESLDSLPRLGEGVIIQKGFEFKGKGELDGRVVESAKRRTGWRQAVLRADDGYPIWGLPATMWIDYSKETLRRGGAMPGSPQVIVNYAPVSRKPWRLKAAIDAVGLAIASRFVVFRPQRSDLTLDVLWAILNSPIANAFAFAISGKRQTLPKEWRQFPVPVLSAADAAAITAAARRYREMVQSKETAFFDGADEDIVRNALLSMDAEVLRVYDLSPKLERQLLALFDGVERMGVGCRFVGYPLGGEAPHLPLHLRLRIGRYHELTARKLGGGLSQADADELRALEVSFDAYEGRYDAIHPFREWLRTFDRQQATIRAKIDAIEVRVAARRSGGNGVSEG